VRECDLRLCTPRIEVHFTYSLAPASVATLATYATGSDGTGKSGRALLRSAARRPARREVPVRGRWACKNPVCEALLAAKIMCTGRERLGRQASFRLGMLFLGSDLGELL
jgi:hypothetical protein